MIVLIHGGYFPADDEDRQMKVLKKGETGRKETIVTLPNDAPELANFYDASGLLVECHHTSAHPSLPKGARFQVKWTFDFSKVSQAKILQAAAEYCVIAKRREMIKIDKPGNDDWNNIIVNPADLIPTKASKADKARKLLEGFSVEELEEMGIVLTDK